MPAHTSAAMPPVEDFRTTIAFSDDLLGKIDELLHEAKSRGELPRNTHRNPFILMLLEHRVNELYNTKKRSTG